MSDEKQTKNKLSKAFKNADIFYYNTHDTYRAGVPDMYAAHGGQSYWLELKRMRGDKLEHPLTMQQAAFLYDVNKAGVSGFIVIEDDDGRFHYREIETIGEVKDAKGCVCYDSVDEFVSEVFK